MDDLINLIQGEVFKLIVNKCEKLVLLGFPCLY